MNPAPSDLCQTMSVLDPRARTRCEVWSRVMGYHRPTAQWNTGKQQEHRDRVLFREPAPVLGFRDEWPHSPPPGIAFQRGPEWSS